MSSPQLPASEQAMQCALRLLGYRQRSEAELRQRLERKGFSPEITDHTLAALTRLGLLDDRDFASAWIAARPGCGPARIRQELRQKGIARDVAEMAIGIGLSAEDELEAAYQVAMRALRSRATPPERDELLRIRRLLQRRGFSFDVIGQVCLRLNDQVTAEGDWLG